MEPGRPVINIAKLPLAELANTEPLLLHVLSMNLPVHPQLTESYFRLVSTTLLSPSDLLYLNQS